MRFWRSCEYGDGGIGGGNVGGFGTIGGYSVRCAQRELTNLEIVGRKRLT